MKTTFSLCKNQIKTENRVKTKEKNKRFEVFTQPLILSEIGDFVKKLITMSGFILCLFLCSCTKNANNNIIDINLFEPQETNTVSYSNPIDEYFIQRIERAHNMVDLREAQDAYRDAWESAFYNVVAWMIEKCLYQEDKDKIIEYECTVNKLIVIMMEMAVTDWLDDYALPPDSPERGIWGNGTRSGLNYMVANIYRDASMLLINNFGFSGDRYVFQDIDYSQEIIDIFHK